MTLASAVAQAGLLGLAVLYPLVGPQSLHATLGPVTYIAPLPPPGPAPPDRSNPTSRPAAHLIPNPLEAPRSVPRMVQLANPAEQPPDLGMSIGGSGSPSDVGVLGGILSGSRTALLVPPPIRVGGAVMEGKRLDQTVPVYPPEAIKEGVMGTVFLEATISTEGRVVNVHVVSGPPLLIQAALDCIAQFRYEPTLLNGVPVDVQTTVNVVFRLIPAKPPQKKKR
jgi:periplasmic protein TonB